MKKSWMKFFGAALVVFVSSDVFSNEPAPSASRQLEGLFKCAHALKNYDTVQPSGGAKEEDGSFSFAGQNSSGEWGLWQVYRPNDNPEVVRACFHSSKQKQLDSITNCDARLLAATRHSCLDTIAGVNIGPRERESRPRYCNDLTQRELNLLPQGNLSCLVSVYSDCKNGNEFTLDHQRYWANTQRVLSLEPKSGEASDVNSFVTITDSSSVRAFSVRIRNMLEHMMSPAVDGPRSGAGNLLMAYQIPRAELLACQQALGDMNSPEINGLKEHLSRVQTWVNNRSQDRSRESVASPRRRGSSSSAVRTGNAPRVAPVQQRPGSR